MWPLSPLLFHQEPDTSEQTLSVHSAAALLADEALSVERRKRGRGFCQGATLTLLSVGLELTWLQAQ